MMTVRDMIGLLREFPEDMRMVVSGYEQGFDDLSPEQITIISVALNTGVHQWEGQHGYSGDLPASSLEVATITEVLALHRTSN